MKIKTEELTGTKLDRAVAQIEHPGKQAISIFRSGIPKDMLP
jgi:hypothetical protein